jgi:hypothetical protein
MGKLVCHYAETTENNTLLTQKNAATLSDANYTIALAKTADKYKTNRTMVGGAVQDEFD